MQQVCGAQTTKAEASVPAVRTGPSAEGSRSPGTLPRRLCPLELRGSAMLPAGGLGSFLDKVPRIGAFATPFLEEAHRLPRGTQSRSGDAARAPAMCHCDLSAREGLRS